MRSSWAQFFLFGLLHVAVFTSAWLQFSADLRCLKTGMSADSGARLAAIRDQFHSSWAGKTDVRRFSSDAALLGIYLLFVTLLMFVGNALTWWAQALLGLAFAFVLILVGVVKRGSQKLKWSGVQLPGLGFSLLSAAVGVAFGYSALEALNFHQALAPYLLFLFGIFGFNIMEHLGLVSMHEPDQAICDDR